MRLNQFSAPRVFAALFVFAPLIASLTINKGAYAHQNALESAQDGTWWQEAIQHQGIAAFNPDRANYKVWRNVKDFGAKGDGVTDDTEAINNAIRDPGTRCGRGCDSSTNTPALIYFPSGTYLISRPIVAMYYSQLVGNPINRPVLKGAPNFAGMSIVDSDPYDENGQNWYTNQNNFFRSVRNFVFDTTAMPASAGTALHWQVAQASSLVNLHFEMSTAPGNLHQGIFMDNGSGGFMSDLTFNGGRFGMWVGNQQFMTRNLKFTNCRTSIYLNWDWEWTFKSVSIDGGEIGLDITATGAKGQSVASVILLDSEIKNVPIGVRTARGAGSAPAAGGSAILDNVKLVNVPQAVASGTGSTILAGGTTTIDLWGQGHVYSPSGARTVVQGPLARPFTKPAALLDGSGKVFEKSRPLYTNIPASNVISVRSHGAKGDGVTDDTAVIQSIFQTYGGNPNNIIYFDHGHYVVTDTIFVPVNTRVVGEVWAVIMAGGSSKFKDPSNPAPVWKIGNPGDEGLVELSELLFETKGPQPGAILLQWNSRDRAGQQGENGMWDVHIRVAGSAGTELEVPQCLKDPQTPITQANHKTQCEVAFMLLHITKTASLYIENCWAWTSDHALDRQFDQITVYNARGILSESTNGPVWMYGTAAEHNTLYQFQLQNTKNVFMATIQTETPYFQANPVATVPFPPLSSWNDPTYAHCTTNACRKSWALRVLNSQDVMIYGAGLYSFFENYSQDCIQTQSCQDSIVDIQNTSKFVIYALNTVATRHMITHEGNNIAPANENENEFSRTVIEFAV